MLTTDAAPIAPGQPVELERGGGGPRLAGRVRRVEPAAFTKVSALGVEEQRVNVVIDLVSPPAEWADLGDAFRVDARIVVERRDDAVTIPVSALFRHEGGWAVFAARDGRARLQPVQIGSRSGVLATVERGVEPGDMVIAYPTTRSPRACACVRARRRPAPAEGRAAVPGGPTCRPGCGASPSPPPVRASLKLGGLCRLGAPRTGASNHGQAQARLHRFLRRAAGVRRQRVRLDRRRSRRRSRCSTRFVDAGFNLIDTADSIRAGCRATRAANPRPIIGSWLEARGRHDDVVIATKVGSDMGLGQPLPARRTTS